MAKSLKKKHKKKGGITVSRFLREKNKVNYVCLVCDEIEQIPYDVVRSFDAMDHGDLTVPPQFSCEKCGGEMYPEYYEGIHGYIYKIEDVKK
ncbi:hypothetical protein [Aneurinibacillus terranovensis]|uniref:hypothetical protein n=1 Tax=Aneurinibacillus terranovensis TaxID=278991 RepID=UPI00041C2581|nr:hypothetical protein [Aneurinibacillus terranovensis]